jgi:hypothetical protein
MTSKLWLIPIIGTLLTGCAAQKSPSAPPLSDEAAAYVSSSRAQMREDKVLVINEAMNLDPADPNNKAFWHEYYQYETELKSVNDERVQLIRDYEFNYEKMDNQIADNLAERALAIHRKKLELLAKYYEKVKKATTPIIAARFIQVEHQLGLILDIEIASQMPLLTQTK